MLLVLRKHWQWLNNGERIIGGIIVAGNQSLSKVGGRYDWPQVTGLESMSTVRRAQTHIHQTTDVLFIWLRY